MPANIEIKARAPRFAELLARAAALSASPCQVIAQEDTFFACQNGRLKLRVLSARHGQLIYYTRPDQDGPKRSEYHVFETDDPENLKIVLSLAHGVRGVVHKTRRLYLIGQTRVHLDVVSELGQFVELEVALQPGQSDQDGQVVAADLMQKLGISTSDLLEGAYMDLIEGKM